jgi:hypothetical protein
VQKDVETTTHLTTPSCGQYRFQSHICMLSTRQLIGV